MVTSFSYSPPPHILKQDLSLKLELTSVLPGPGNTGVYCHASFYMSAGSLNSGPHACVASS